MTSTVGTKGQITISKEHRDALGIEPGWRSIQRLEGSRVILEFLPPKHRRSLKGILSEATSVKVSTSTELERLTDSVWLSDIMESGENNSVADS